MSQLLKINKKQFPIIFFVLLTVINALTFRINIIAISIALIEIFIVVFELFSYKLEKAFLYLIFFLSTVIENSYFATGLTSDEIKLYSFQAVPYLRTYHILAFVGLIYVLSAVKQYKDKINKYSKRLVLIWIVALFVTLISFVFNDNRIRELWGLTRLVIVDGYNAFFTVGVFVICLRLMNYNETFKEDLKSIIISILKGAVIAAYIILILGGKRRTEAGDLYLICPLVLYWSPALILFYKSEKKISYILYSVLSVIIQVKYTVGIPGAWWLTTGIIFIVFIIDVLRDVRFIRNNKVAFIFTALIVVFGVSGLFVLLSNSGSSSYIVYKLKTALSIFSISSDPMSWLNGMGTSIGVRVEEIVNVFIELFKSPFYLLTGKGFGGTITHHWGIYWWGRYGVFSDAQNAAQTYSVFHTGIAEMIINFGFFGLCCVFSWIKNVFVSIFKKCNHFILIGSLYFLLFYSYYWSMIICIAIMALGVFEKINNKNAVD